MKIFQKLKKKKSNLLGFSTQNEFFSELCYIAKTVIESVERKPGV